MTVLSVASLPMLSACSSSAEDASDLVPVGENATVQVESQDIATSLTLSGVVQKSPALEVAAPIAGDLQILVKSGEPVKAKQVIGKIKGCDGDLKEDDETGELVCPKPDIYNVRASGNGTLAWRMKAGEVDADDLVAQVRRKGFIATFDVTDGAQKYALLDEPVRVTGEIVGGPAGFEMEYLGVVDDSGQLTDGEKDNNDGFGDMEPGGAPVGVQTQLPDDVKLMAGLDVVATFVLSEVSDVPTLPLSAVRGRKGEGQVVVVREDGTREVVTVELKSRDMERVEVEGLETGVQVLQYPLSTDFDA